MKKTDHTHYDIDRYLIEMLKLGDTRAFSALYEKYWSPLYKRALQQTQSKEAAEELTQDIFLSLWARKQHLKLEKSFQAYIYTSLKYRIINYIKSQVVQRKYKEKVTTKASLCVVEEEISYKELNNAFEREFKKLPSKYQHVFLMRKREGLSFKEISHKLQIPLSTAEKHMSKATKMLRSNLREYAASFVMFLHLYSLNG